ncbi:hypothetical protein DFH05DRAFT_1493630 [Lentinula detonsa]|uniref:Ribosomal RNA methyltransferase FtsJ domain-containing protein n=1 Tax=Lentinula detonsa TaxID=2804962 RepID=A0A9W8TXF7_9AGAR|nr:hypothetical protein DFH05DRAFT_1493630 [Lentinula detonsa]
MAERISPDIDDKPKHRSFADALIGQPGGIHLKELLEIREVGWNADELDIHYAKQRRVADSPNFQTEHAWFQKMKTIFRELDTHAGIVPSSGRFTFLDLGFCPGGFTSYILSCNAAARGTGISLPFNQSGHAYLLEESLRWRFEPHFGDLGFYNLLNEDLTLYLRNVSLRKLPHTILNSHYDLVILDGHYLRTYVDPSHEAPIGRWEANRLMISQIIISLQSIASGGTAVMKLSRPEHYYTAAILYMLDEISTSLELVKPFTMHRTRGTFYAVAKGIGASNHLQKKKEEYLFQFRLLWYEISFGGTAGQGRFIDGHGKDLDFIASYDQLRSGYMERLAYLSKDVWRIQMEALHEQFRRRGIISW